MKLTLLSGVLVLGAVLTISAFAEEKRSDDPGFSPQQLAKRTLDRRAVEAVIWGMPAVNAELMFDAMVRPGPTSTRSSTGRVPSIGRTKAHA